MNLAIDGAKVEFEGAGMPGRHQARLGVFLVPGHEDIADEVRQAILQGEKVA